MESLLAWGHFLAGITWIGILYYFNFIQVPFLKVVTPETKAEAFKHLVPNALWCDRCALCPGQGPRLGLPSTPLTTLFNYSPD